MNYSKSASIYSFSLHIPLRNPSAKFCRRLEGSPTLDLETGEGLGHSELRRASDTGREVVGKEERYVLEGMEQFMQMP